MVDRPQYFDDYKPYMLEAVRSTCLHVATRLGDDLMRELILVGGLVPSLLPMSTDDPRLLGQHAGTSDLDLGLELAVLDNNHYKTIVEKLKLAGFRPALNERGIETKQTWQVLAGTTPVKVDFLINPIDSAAMPGKLQNFTADFAAINVPGLELAFRDSVPMTISGTTLDGARAERTINVCGPAAFVVLKSLAHKYRGNKDKDAYDLLYVLQRFAGGIEEIVRRLYSFGGHPQVADALGVLKTDFSEIDATGIVRFTNFLFRERNEEAEADAAGAVKELLRHFA